MKRIAIIGGGISGLSAAHALAKKRSAGGDLDYVLYESSPRFGGVLVTEHVDGCLVEAGPDSFISEKPWAADLCREIGLVDQLIGSNDADRKTYILLRGRLVEMPDGLMFMVPTKILPAIISPLFSAGTKLRMAQEWFHPPRRADGDESVASFVKRHYGSEVVDRLAEPLLSGVYGGDSSQLSVRAVLPRFVEMEAKYGSLGRAMLAARGQITAVPKKTASSLFTSLREGMQQMVDALVARLNRKALIAEARVSAVRPEARGWVVSAGLDSDYFDGVILALPGPAAAHLLQMWNAELSAWLGGIAYSSSVTVTLGYGLDVRQALPSGFGFLVPRSEGTRMLAATFVHNKFPRRAPEDRALVRCFLGGSRDEQILAFSDHQIIGVVRAELKQIVGITAEPLFARVFKWRGAMAQYGVGHLERLQRIEALRQKQPGLALAGNAFTGIGVPDCVRSGAQAAETVLESLGMTRHQKVADSAT
jgi:oxygen-dependent protoporphyrinogen oxidase